MLGQIAIVIDLAFVSWLYARDRSLRPMRSWRLWVVLLWIVVIGSRPISSWLGLQPLIMTPHDYLEGSPLDRNVFVALILAGGIALLSRRLDWGRLVTSNAWLFIFLLYWAISTTWSDYPVVALKRWFKDIGNVIMVLILATEKQPGQAVRAVFIRYVYFAIPLSVVLIKYFPDLGRYYNVWTWQPGYSGVTTNKNELGAALLVCGLVVLWDWAEMTSAGSRIPARDFASRAALVSMIGWLIAMAGSSTAFVCLLLAGGIFLLMQRAGTTAVRRHARYLGTYALLFGVLVLGLYLLFGPETLTATAGREDTFTGRTELWTDLLDEPHDPILGAGFQSFWLGPAAARIWSKYTFHPNQAHNGYLETYLNGGLIGLAFLLGAIIAAGVRLKRELQSSGSYAYLRVAFLVAAVVYNWTEAAFNGVSLLWLLFLIAALTYPAPSRSRRDVDRSRALSYT